MKKIAQGIVRLRKLILTVAVLLLIPSAIGAIATRINYDILLPAAGSGLHDRRGSP